MLVVAGVIFDLPCLVSDVGSVVFWGRTGPEFSDKVLKVDAVSRQ
jgi:hypothetical protein